MLVVESHILYQQCAVLNTVTQRHTTGDTPVTWAGSGGMEEEPINENYSCSSTQLLF